MPQAGSLGALLVSIGTDMSELDKGMRQADVRVQQFERESNNSLNAFKAVGVAAAVAVSAAFIKLGKDTFEYGARLHELSVQTGMTASDIARLQFITGQVDASFEGVTSSLKILARSMYEAANGNQEFRQVFSRLGIELRDAQGNLRKASEVIYEMGPALQRLGNETEMVAIGQKILGRGFQENIGFFKATKTEMDALRETNINATDKLNEFAATVDSLSDKMRGWMDSTKNFIAEAATPFLKWLDAVTQSAEKQEAQLKKNFQQLRSAPDVKRFLDQQTENERPSSETNFLRNLGQDQNPPQSLIASPGIGGAAPTGAPAPGGLAAQGASDPNLRAKEGFAEWRMQMTQEMNENNNPWLKMQEDMQAFQEKFFNVQSTLSEGFQQMTTGFVTSFGSAFARMGQEGANFNDVVKGFWEDLKSSVLNQIGQMMAKWMAFMALKAVTGPFGGILGGLFRQGGVLAARDGMAFSAADGIAMTPSMGERGIPVMAHPNEVISPIDKFIELVQKSKSDIVNVYPTGRAGDDPQALAEAIAMENDRRRRRP